MKNFYYFSKTKLKFIEIRNFHRKFILIALGSSLLISGLIFGAYYLYSQVFNPDSETVNLQIENKALAERLDFILENYKRFEEQIDSLSSYNNDLRLMANLRPISTFDRKFGVGGSIKLDVPVSSRGLGKIVNSLDSTIARVSAKLSYEKNNYREISKKLEYNKRLWESIPAIKPTKVGRFGDGFGTRMHPILKVRRMHQGVDIIVDSGTKVFSTGSGKVISVKHESGLGLTVEIDHGFGYISRYGHLLKANVSAGQKVSRGIFIALSGNSGRLTTGPHLHYEVIHNGISLDPENFIFDELNLFDN